MGQPARRIPRNHDDRLEEVTAEERVQCEANEQDYIEKLEAEGAVFTEFDEASKAEIVEIFGQYWTEKIEALGNPEAVEMLNKIIEMKG